MDTGLVAMLSIVLTGAVGGVGGVWFYMRHSTEARITAAQSSATLLVTAEQENSKRLIAEMQAHMDNRIKQVQKHAEDRITDLQDAFNRERVQMVERHGYEVSTLRSELSEARIEIRQLNDIMGKSADALTQNAASQDALVTLMHTLVPKAAASN
jgi:vacuolar-type H+-ATPase subunit I/STV1